MRQRVSLQKLAVEVPGEGGRECITVEAHSHAGMRGVEAVCASGMLGNLIFVQWQVGLVVAFGQ